MKKIYDFDLAVSYLNDYPLDYITTDLKNAAINLANAGLTSDKWERGELIMQAQSAIFTVTEFLDSIIERQVEQ